MKNRAININQPIFTLDDLKRKYTQDAFNTFNENGEYVYRSGFD
jgi:hypothetical protein